MASLTELEFQGDLHPLKQGQNAWKKMAQEKALKNFKYFLFLIKKFNRKDGMQNQGTVPVCGKKMITRWK